MSDAAARDLRVVGVGRERVICHPTVNRYRRERQPTGDGRRDNPSRALTAPGERQHVDGCDERALGPHRDEERRDDRLPRGWTNQRKRDEAGECHGLHARRGVEQEGHIEREKEAGEEGRAIVTAPDERGDHDQRRRDAQHLGGYPDIDAEPRGAREQQHPQQRRVPFDVLAGVVPCAESIPFGQVARISKRDVGIVERRARQDRRQCCRDSHRPEREHERGAS